jgi:glucose-6-phosphate 1-dehydrogenase
MAENFSIFTILGATGDLVDKKIIPALYALFTKGIISEKTIKIIAFARRDFNAGKYHAIIDHSLETYGMVDLKKANLEAFYKLFDYHQGQFDQKKDFTALAEKINIIQKTKGICAHKVFYLAVPTDLYNEVIVHIQDTQLQDMCSQKPDIYSKLIIEKPFGKDLKTSMKLDGLLKRVFTENQIYRLDHYLGKSVIPELLNFRKNNFIGQWNKDLINKVSISTVEELGVEKRGDFYDAVGALVDVGQNHLVEIAAILTMPMSDIENNFQKGRANMLNTLKIFSREDIQKYTYRAQYEGYRNIENVDSHSIMETYFKVAAFFNNKDWQGVPFYLESGKRCGVTKKEIVVEFKNGRQVIIDFAKKLGIIVDGKELQLLNPGSEDQQYVGEYMVLFKEMLDGFRENFVSLEEIQASWKFVDPIRLAWNNNVVPLDIYKPDDAIILSKAKI